MCKNRFTLRDASEMSRRLREMMEEAPDESVKREIEQFADTLEDSTALDYIELFPSWKGDIAYKVGASINSRPRDNSRMDTTR